MSKAAVNQARGREGLLLVGRTRFMACGSEMVDWARHCGGGQKRKVKAAVDLTCLSYLPLTMVMAIAKVTAACGKRMLLEARAGAIGPILPSNT